MVAGLLHATAGADELAELGTHLFIVLARRVDFLSALRADVGEGHHVLEVDPVPDTDLGVGRDDVALIVALPGALGFRAADVGDPHGRFRTFRTLEEVQQDELATGGRCFLDDVQVGHDQFAEVAPDDTAAIVAFHEALFRIVLLEGDIVGPMFLDHVATGQDVFRNQSAASFGIPRHGVNSDTGITDPDPDSRSDFKDFVDRAGFCGFGLLGFQVAIESHGIPFVSPQFYWSEWGL